MFNSEKENFYSLMKMFYHMKLELDLHHLHTYTTKEVGLNGRKKKLLVKQCQQILVTMHH